MPPKKTTTKAAEAAAAEEAVVTAPAEIAEAPEAVEAPKPAEDPEKSRAQYMRELVPVTPAAPRAGEDPNYPIGINGKMWLLPKGKTSRVPRYVAMAFNQAEAAKGTQLSSQAELLKKQNGNTVDLSSLTADQVAQLKALLGL